MEKTRSWHSLLLSVFVAVSYLVMVVLNALANALPINGMGTGAISDAYPNLFAPAGLTFAIWGLIYLLLAGYTVAQFGFLGGQKSAETARRQALTRIGLYFAASSLVNAVWILAWHYLAIPVSLLLMLAILTLLILIREEIRKQPLSRRDKLLLRLPFSVYFGWITVATIANVTTFLVSLELDSYGLSEPAWMAVALAAGLAIGGAAMLRNRDIAYGLVLIWAYAGILIKHLSAESAGGWGGKYPLVTIGAIVCLALFSCGEIYLLATGSKKGW